MSILSGLNSHFDHKTSFCCASCWIRTNDFLLVRQTLWTYWVKEALILYCRRGSNPHTLLGSRLKALLLNHLYTAAFCVTPSYTIPLSNYSQRAGIEPVKNYLQIIVAHERIELSLQGWKPCVLSVRRMRHKPWVRDLNPNLLRDRQLCSHYTTPTNNNFNLAVYPRLELDSGGRQPPRIPIPQ